MIESTQVKDRASLNQDQISEFVRLYGGSASNAVFDEGFRIFSGTEAAGIVGYRVEAGCAIVFGDPLCSPQNLRQVATEFNNFCKEQNYQVIYMIASDDFAKCALDNNICEAKVEVGAELYLDPADTPQKGSNAVLLRKKVKHAKAEGLEFHEYLPGDPLDQSALEKVAEEWLKGRTGPQIYLSHVHIFADKANSRWFYAKKGEELVGVIFLSKMDAKEGWLLNLLMPMPDAPNGTSEFLVMEALQVLQNEGCKYLSFGIATGEELGEIIGLGACSTWLARKVYKGANKAFHLDGRKKYWMKYEPKSSPVSVLLSDPHVKLKHILALSRALNVKL